MRGAGETGRAAEDRAAEHLRRLGYRIVERNFRARCGEIDIVAERKGTIVFVEVRFRARADFGSAVESVGFRKRERVRRAALEFLASRGTGDRPVRFDVIGIDGADLDHVEDAFDGEG